MYRNYANIVYIRETAVHRLNNPLLIANIEMFHYIYIYRCNHKSYTVLQIAVNYVFVNNDRTIVNLRLIITWLVKGLPSLMFLSLPSTGGDIMTGAITCPSAHVGFTCVIHSTDDCPFFVHAPYCRRSIVSRGCLVFLESIWYFIVYILDQMLIGRCHILDAAPDKKGQRALREISNNNRKFMFVEF